MDKDFERSGSDRPTTRGQGYADIIFDRPETAAPDSEILSTNYGSSVPFDVIKTDANGQGAFVIPNGWTTFDVIAMFNASVVTGIGDGEVNFVTNIQQAPIRSELSGSVLDYSGIGDVGAKVISKTLTVTNDDIFNVPVNMNGVDIGTSPTLFKELAIAEDVVAVNGSILMIAVLIVETDITVDSGQGGTQSANTIILRKKS